MTLDEQNKHFDEFVLKMKQILNKKGNDYSFESDKLSNFKLSANICGITTEQQCLSIIATKVARLGVLLKLKVSPINESIQDSVLDLANYTILLDMIISESDKKTESVEINIDEHGFLK